MAKTFNKIRDVMKIKSFCITETSHEPRGVTGGFLSQRASNTEIVYMAWRHHGTYFSDGMKLCNSRECVNTQIMKHSDTRE